MIGERDRKFFTERMILTFLRVFVYRSISENSRIRKREKKIFGEFTHFCVLLDFVLSSNDCYTRNRFGLCFRDRLGVHPVHKDDKCVHNIFIISHVWRHFPLCRCFISILFVPCLRGNIIRQFLFMSPSDKNYVIPLVNNASASLSCLVDSPRSISPSQVGWNFPFLIPFYCFCSVKDGKSFCLLVFPSLSSSD